jgi:hypothetical protein
MAARTATYQVDRARSVDILSQPHSMGHMDTLDDAKQLNRRALYAGLIWALILHIIRQVILAILNLPAGQPIRQMVTGALFFVVFMSYPMLINGVMQAQTPIWRNPMVHATAGSALALIGLLLISALGTGLWLETAISFLAIWLVLEVMLPWLRGSKFLTQETKQHKKAWRQLGDLTLAQILFLQIPEL